MRLSGTALSFLYWGVLLALVFVARALIGEKFAASPNFLLFGLLILGFAAIFFWGVVLYWRGRGAEKRERDDLENVMRDVAKRMIDKRTPAKKEGDGD